MSRKPKSQFIIENRYNSQEFANKPQHSSELFLGNFALKLVFYPKGLQNNACASLHVQARKVKQDDVCSKKTRINCRVELVQSNSNKLLKNESIWIDLTTGPKNKKIKQWQSFITNEKFKQYSGNNGKFVLYWKIEEISTERVMSSPDNRLTNKYLSSENNKYNPREFNVKFGNMQRNNGSMIDDGDVMTFRLLLKRIYDGYYGMEKMFIDQMWFQYRNGKTKLCQTCDYELGKVQVNQESFELKYNDSLVLNIDKFQDAYKYEQVLKQELSATISDKDAKRRHYVYMILDPLITDNLPSRAFELFRKLLVDGIKSGETKTFNLTNLLNHELFRDFVKAIVYVGCGQKGRMYTHCEKARRNYNKKNVTTDRLTKRIHKIWKNSHKKQGPILFDFNVEINKFEATRYEGLFIQSIQSISGLNNLVNQRKGEKDHNISEQKRREFGLYLLSKAFMKHLLKGEDQEEFNNEDEEKEILDYQRSSMIQDNSEEEESDNSDEEDRSEEEPVVSEEEPENSDDEPEHSEEEPENSDDEPEHSEEETENSDDEPEHSEEEPENSDDEPEHSEEEPESSEEELDDNSNSENSDKENSYVSNRYWLKSKLT